MGKIISSPVKRFPGTVTLCEPLFYPQAIAMRDALAAARELKRGTQMDYNHVLLPGVIACVEKWNLTGVAENPTPDTFPVTPTESAGRLAAWLIGEVVKLYQENEEEIPKA